MSLTQAEAQSVTWQSDRRALDKIKPYFSHGLQLICGLALPVLMLCLHFAVSASRILWSVLIGASVGLFLGTWLAVAKRSRDYVFPSINLIAQFPIVGWIPLLMIFLGIDEALKIAAISLAVFPSIISGLRQGIMQAWLALVFVELLASSEGIGYLMVWGRQLLQLDIIFMAIVLIGLTGYFLDSGLAIAEKVARFYATRVGAKA